MGARTTSLVMGLLAFILMTSEAMAQCDPETSGVDVYLGYDHRLSDHEWRGLGDAYSRAMILQLVWVPLDEDIRYRQKYVIELDHWEKTLSPVMVWDGKLNRVVDDNLSPVVFGPETIGPYSGWRQIHLKICPEVWQSAGPPLFYVYHGVRHMSLIYRDRPRVVPVVRNTANSDLETSQIIRDRFNEGLKQRVHKDIALETGVEPGAYLAEGMLFQNLTFVEGLLENEPLVFLGNDSTVILRNRIYLVTSEFEPGHTVRVLPSVASVKHEGVELLGNGSISNLEDHLGVLSFTLKDDPEGQVGHALVLDGRSDFELELGECVNGRQRMQANFVHDSDVAGEIYYEEIDFKGGRLATGPFLDKRVPCDLSFTVFARRYSGQNTISIDTKTVFRQ